jgi:phenylalanine-specific permease
MIAMGSAIGTGLFLISASTVRTAGPVVLTAYVVAGVIIFFIMRMLGEMAVDRPVPGSYSTYAHDYIGKPAGFVTGWNWWFTCIVVSMLELTATGVFMQYWFPHLPTWVTALVALVAIAAVNLIRVSAFGEFEFWFSVIKVTAIVAMIVLGIALIVGLGHHHAIGISNLWSYGGFAPKGLSGWLLSLVAVTFTFGGVESLGTTAGEVKDPARTIPKAINRVIYRILIFYVGAIGIMLIIWPWTRIGLDGSPFVLILAGLGIGGAAFVLNIVVVTATLSVYNTMIYSNARVLYGLAKNGQAPAFLARTNRQGVPVAGLLVNTAITGLVVLFNYLFPGKLITPLVSIILGAEFITWGAITIAHLRFRKTAEAGQLTFKSPWYPYSNYLCLAYFVLVFVLMYFAPGFRTGFYVFPAWLVGLCIVGVATQRYTGRRRHGAAALVGQPLSADKA